MAQAILSETEFSQQVNAALKNFNSVLALARSPLADSALVTPLLLLDDVSPTADERGHALRLLLRWAVHRLAPEAPPYPLGVLRPYDDPTWRDPAWWQYNILRHRYLEPIHPDEYVESGRATETLIALTGIPSTDAYFDERNRAIRTVAQWLRQQLIDGAATAELRNLALDEITRPLRNDNVAGALLDIASTFTDVFPRALLLKMAAAERLTATASALTTLTNHRLIQVGDGAQNLWLSPALQAYVYARQARDRLSRRHQLVAEYYLDAHEPLRAARHFLLAQEGERSAQVLLGSAQELINELQADELCDLLVQLRANQVCPATWRDVQILISDLHQRNGRHIEAIAACRRALKAAPEVHQQARIYRRMGKLYEQHNQLHALGYYQQAVDRFAPDDPELLEVLKDRGWLHLLRQDWQKAETDLRYALHHAPADALELRANIYDALAHLYYLKKHFPSASNYAQQALVIREQVGDMARIANSFCNLGLIYNAMGEYEHAIRAQEEAMTIYARVGNQAQVAISHLNIGMAHHLAGRLDAAVAAYCQCVELCQAIGLPLVEVRGHANLAEAYAQMEKMDAAQQHWRAGYVISQAGGFDDEIAALADLATDFPGLQRAQVETLPTGQAEPPSRLAELSSEEQAILELVDKVGQVTPKLLQETLRVSKATATRKLADLVERGLLVQHGRGRGTHYKRSTGPQLPSTPAVAVDQTGSAQIVSTLRQHDAMLRSEYALIALGLVSAEQTPGNRAAPVQLAVRFSCQPDLRAFFGLEQHLSSLICTRVDLLPIDVVDAAVPATEIVWIWT